MRQFLRRSSLARLPTVGPARDNEACDTFAANNVGFLFPSSTHKEPFLYANMADLVSQSPYWETMFSSGYLEATSELGSVQEWRKKLHQELLQLLDANRSSKRRKSETSAAVDEKIRCIVIKDVPLSIYRSVLVWVASRRITFAPLGMPRTVKASSEVLPNAAEVYALAHQVQLEPLQKLALNAFDCQLTEKNMIQHLFSTSCYLYPELRNAALEACISSWAALKQAGAVEHIQSVIAAGQSHSESISEIVGALFKSTT